VQAGKTTDIKQIVTTIRELTSSIEENLGNMDLNLLSGKLEERKVLIEILRDSEIDERIFLKILYEIRERDAVIRARLSLVKAEVSKDIKTIRKKQEATEMYSAISRQTC